MGWFDDRLILDTEKVGCMIAAISERHSAEKRGA